MKFQQVEDYSCARDTRMTRFLLFAADHTTAVRDRPIILSFRRSRVICVSVGIKWLFM